MKTTTMGLRLAYLMCALLIPLVGHADMIGFWKLDEGSGTLIGDSSGSGNTGTLVNANSGTWTNGNSGGAVYFNPAVGSQILIPDSASLQITTTMTVTAWVRPHNLNRDNPILAVEGAGGLAFNFQLNMGSISLLLDSNGSYGWELANYHALALPTDAWTHLAATWDGATIRYYTNGIALGFTDAFATPLFNSTDSVGIGVNSDWNSTHFDGILDEVRLYNTALTGTEIQSVIPEPGSAALLLLGLAGLLGVRRVFR